MIICFGSLFQGYNVGVLNLAQPRLNIVYDIVENKALYQGKKLKKYICKYIYKYIRIYFL